MADTQISRSSTGASRNPATEAAVLDAAAAILAEEGYGAMTMEAVARRARAGKATLYRWWPSRGHLLLALFSRAKAEIPEPDTGSLRGDLVVYLAETLRRWNGEDGETPVAPLLRLLIAEAQIDPAVRTAMAEERRARWHHCDNIIARAAARGEVNPALPARAGERRIISLLWHLLLIDDLPPAAEAAMLADQMMPGLTG